MRRLDILLLGTFAVAVDGEPITEFGYDKVRGLLAYLAVEGLRPQRRDTLAGLLWPEQSQPEGLNNLRTALTHLRSALLDRDADVPFVLVARDSLRLNPDSSIRVDAARFARLVARSLRHGHDRGKECGACVAAMTEAVALYQGGFMPGFALDSAAFEEWIVLQRASLHEQVLDLLDRLAAYDEARGNYEGALSHARAQLHLEPWRERAHRQVMRALAFTGQRAAAVAQFEACREVLIRELGVEPEPLTVELYEQLRSNQPLNPLILEEPTAVRALRRVGPCPYRGLAAFREADAKLFFGRDAFVDRLLHAITGPHPVSVVVGPSGSGKSSVIHAGLLPRLRGQGDWAIASLRPGREPFRALASAWLPLSESGAPQTGTSPQLSALARALRSGQVALTDLVASLRERRGEAVHILLLVDQFEELYTLCDDLDARLRFIDALLDGVTAPAAADDRCSRVALLLGLRADFVGQALAYRRFADVLQTASQMLGPMTSEELREAIEKPAVARGAVFEAGLVTRLLDDITTAPGNLPLLEFALTLLWRRLRRGWLTHAAYDAIGRVQGALARYAEDVYGALCESDRGLCRRISVQLVQPGKGTEDTRRVAHRADVGDEAWPLVQHLADQRLVVTARDDQTGTETVELVHEALIQHWARLQRWLAEDRVFRIWQERLRMALDTWESTQRDRGAVLRGAPLVEAEEWLRTRSADLSEAERTFVEAGLAAREARRRAELETAREIAAARDQAIRQREEALRQAAVGLASEARNQMRGPDQDAAVLLALEAVEHYPYAWQAELALAEIVLQWRILMQTVHGSDMYAPAWLSPDGTRLLTSGTDSVFRVWDCERMEALVQVAASPVAGSHLHAWWSPDGSQILTASDDELPQIWDASSGDLLVELAGHGGWRAEWSPDGTRVLTSCSTQEDAAVLWDPATGEVVYSLPGSRGFMEAAHFSPDGHWVATSVGQIWDACSGELRHTLTAFQDLIDRDVQMALCWSPDGARVGSSLGGVAVIWEAATGKEIVRFHTGYAGRASMYWSPQGERLLLVSDTIGGPAATLWNANTGTKLRMLPFYDVQRVADPWSPSGDRLLLADSQGSVSVWEADSGRELLRLSAHTGNMYANWLPSGTGFVSASLDGNARIWRISPANLEVNGQDECPGYIFDGFSIPVWSPDGSRVGRGFADGTVGIWDLATATRVLHFRKRSKLAPDVRINYLAWSPDGARIATGTIGGEVDIWDSACGAHLSTIPGQQAAVVGLHWSPNGQRLLTCVRQRKATIWDPSTATVLSEYVGPDFFQGAWSPDGSRIVLVDQFSYRGPVKVWDARSGQSILTLLPDDFAYGTAGVAWSPDGSRIVTFSTDSVGRLWDADTGEKLASFHAPGNCMVAEWSPSGSRFLVGSLSGVYVWDAATLEQVIVYPAGDKLWGSWSPDGTAIALAYANQDLRVYPAWQSLEDLIAYAKEHCVMRELTIEERARYGLPPQGV